MFERLDAVLKTRFTPNPPEGLASRIIARASLEPQSAGSQSMPVAFLQELWAEVKALIDIPGEPAYALAVLFLIGVVLGLVLDGSILSAGLDTRDLAGLLEVNDRFVASEWV